MQVVIFVTLLSDQSRAEILDIASEKSSSDDRTTILPVYGNNLAAMLETSASLILVYWLQMGYNVH